jgi:hypothetical protein
MSKLLSYFIESFKILIATITFGFLLCVVSSAAMADTANCIKEGPVSIRNGRFSVSTESKVPQDFIVRSAIVSLPDGVTGTIDEINISALPSKSEIGSAQRVEFGCSSIKNVKNGTNLIKVCGGPAVLKAGNTSYQAQGSDFPSDSNLGNFSIKLCPDFAE